MLSPTSVGELPSDEQLMLAYASGDSAAFEQLYRRHRKRLYAFIARALWPTSSVDDCFQETWARIIKARRRYQPRAAFRTWMLQIAHHLVIDHLRRKPMYLTQDPERFSDHSEHDEDGRSTPEILQLRREDIERLQSAINLLPAEQRLALQLKWTEQLSLEEIAIITGVGRETVKSRLRYAMDKLREHLSP